MLRPATQDGLYAQMAAVLRVSTSINTTAAGGSASLMMVG